MNRLGTKQLVAGFLIAAGSLSTAHAEYLGLLSGRSADPGDLAKISIDIGVADSSDLRNIAVRGNYRVNDTITAFAHVGQSDFGFGFGDFDGLSIGGGAQVYLPDQRIIESLDLAAKGSLAFASLDGPFRSEVDLLAVTAEAVLSPKEAITSNGLKWYATGGLAVVRADGGGDDDTEVEPTVGGGITLPLGPGTLFAGAELVDEFHLGVGYRFGL